MNWPAARDFGSFRNFCRKTELVLALALVGWYLMIAPPRQINDRFETNFSAPLDKWVQLRLFKLQSECEAARDAYAKNPPAGVTDMLSSKADALTVMKAAKCVSTDDPRLIAQ
jgi:hypothetical protein